MQHRIPLKDAAMLYTGQLYTTTRVSSFVLTYYSLCLINGNYTIKLHFAEIIFINERSLNSLGKRVFGVYIQGNLVLEDFDIQGEAGGTGKPIVKTFNATVMQPTLEIHFYWAGKGTPGISTRGVYGPLVSANLVSPNIKPPSRKDDNRTDVILAIGIVVGVLVLLLLGLVFMRWIGWLGGKDPMYKELRGINLQTGLFTLRQFKAATKNFDATNKTGEGGFGCVYKGLLSNGTIIATKHLFAKFKQGITNRVVGGRANFLASKDTRKEADAAARRYSRSRPGRVARGGKDDATWEDSWLSRINT
ncbi:probable LRR receptor-like serine/threonine-protein kinase At1g07650 [Vigna radiata var. radiata]|uniref:non-specific serine/threonine protein kinase n=1 Tax=Vigna radiata var. radiata TaxID=3916 RepID=A0A3Q0FDY5_VIGRR|nr:probable LRR receptor-like serine/threonine-protein kinase At1g07650 [Vigna radiata var. radiata]